VLFLHDADGYLGQRVAEFWVLEEQMDDEEKTMFHNFIMDKISSIKLDMENHVSKLERERNVLVATAKPIKPLRLSNMLYQVFESIYYERIPFPFDGFSTARGNAAKDCQIFTRQFFLGLLDRNWLMTQAAQQKNRGEKVLDKAWGVFDNDGSLRLKPRNESLRKIIEILEGSLQPVVDDSGKLNLGHAMRLLCAPPYGLNIASAGLVIAIFIGKRRSNLNFLLNQQLISIEAWLPDALQGNYLNLTILDNTDVVVVSQETISEWEKLLEDWDNEEAYSGKIAFYDKAIIMQETIPIPQFLFYKYDNLATKARSAQLAINDYNKTLDDAIEKIHNGNEKSKLNLLAWGAVMLRELLSSMEMKDNKWTSEQIEVVQKNLASARIETQQMFPNWYTRQNVRAIENLGDFKRQMHSVERNLASLGLDEEQKKLAAHIEEIEKNVRFIEELKQTISNIKQIVDNNVINDSTTMQTLTSWLEQVQALAKGLEEVRLRTNVVEQDIRDAKVKLAKFQRECLDQVERNKERLVKIFDIEEINNLGQISTWKHEVMVLLSIFEEDKNIEDLRLVQEQLILFEKHFKLLDDSELNNQEFQNLLQQYEQETKMYFEGDDPPLNSEAIYSSICDALQEKRSSLARIWMEKHMPVLEDIMKYEPVKSLQTIASLQKRPKLLSDDQVKDVRKAIAACEARIDVLEVDGLLAKFQGMSEQNKKSFIKKIEDQIEKYISNTA
jgi:hypothetical protein